MVRDLQPHAKLIANVDIERQDIAGERWDFAPVRLRCWLLRPSALACHRGRVWTRSRQKRDRDECDENETKK